MSKYKNKPDDTYRSNLERVAASLLSDYKIPYRYEPFSLVLMEPFEWDIVSYERVGKAFKAQSKKLRSITYTPDFVGNNWIMETKGMKTPAFQMKWKLFKRYLRDNNLWYNLFMPTNKKEIIKSIEIIKEL